MLGVRTWPWGHGTENHIRCLELVQLFLLLNFMFQYSADADYHWRFAKSLFQLSELEGSLGNLDRKKELVYNSLESAKQAVNLDDNSANSHKW